MKSGMRLPILKISWHYFLLITTNKTILLKKSNKIAALISICLQMFGIYKSTNFQVKCLWKFLLSFRSEFFWAGEVSWDNGTWIKSSRTKHERRSCKEKISDFFLPDLCKTAF